MQLRNTHRRFGLVALSFHWLVAALFVAMIAIGLTMTALALTHPWKFPLYQFHKSLGVTIFALVALRLLWRVSGPVLMTNGSSVNGTILTTQRSGGAIGYFLPLQQGDTGVRSVESVQCVLGTDVGLFTMVLVKPLCDISLREITAPMEIDFYLDRGASMPVIEDDAYLGFITMPNSSLSAAALNGLATFTWK